MPENESMFKPVACDCGGDLFKSVNLSRFGQHRLKATRMQAQPVPAVQCVNCETWYVFDGEQGGIIKYARPDRAIAKG